MQCVVVVIDTHGSKPVTITYWSSSSQAEINWLDSHFNASHKTIKVQGQYIASADDTTAKEVAALKSGTEPNVVIGQDPSALPLLAESGKVVDLSKPLAAETNSLYPGDQVRAVLPGAPARHGARRRG